MATSTGRRGNIPGILLLLAALILLILVSVSVPVVKSIYFLRAELGGRLTLGMWGACFQPNGLARECTKKALGYDLDLSFLNLNHNTRIGAAVIRGLSKAEILHPIAAVVTFIALLFALSGHVIVDILATIIAFIAFLVTLIAFIIDCVLWITARHRINDVDSRSATLGNAFWMVLGALVAQLLASLLVCWGGHTRRRSAASQRDPFYNGNGNMTGNGTNGNGPIMMQQRRHFWQRGNKY